MAAVYYNEFDPKAAAWLRELMAAGLIPEGDVDERSIEDVRPADIKGYTQCHFFAGIGGWPYALRLAGWPDDWPVWTGSPPCQPFSNAGKKKGEADDRHLWPAWFRLIKAVRPDIIFGEQVASKLGREWLHRVRFDLEHVFMSDEGREALYRVLSDETIRGLSPLSRAWETRAEALVQSLPARIREEVAQQLQRVQAEAASEALGLGRGEVQENRSLVAREGDINELRTTTRGSGKGVASKAGREWLAGVHADLEAMGYAVGAADLPAACVGAPHIRQRLWWVAYTASGRRQKRDTNEWFVQLSGQDRDDGRLENPECIGWRRRDDGRFNGDSGGLHAETEVAGPGTAGAYGFWDDAIWIPCADGKARRIVSRPVFMANGVPARMATLRSQSHEEEVKSAEEASACSDEALQTLRLYSYSQTFQWTFGRQECIHAPQVLRPQVHGCGDGRENQGFECQEQQKAGYQDTLQVLRPLWQWLSSSGSSSGWKSAEQRAIESGYVVRLLSHATSLARLEKDEVSATALFALRQACEASGLVQYTLDSLSQIWESFVAKRAAEWGMGLVHGRFEIRPINPLVLDLPGRVALLRGAGNAIVPVLAAVFVKAYMEAVSLVPPQRAGDAS